MGIEQIRQTVRDRYDIFEWKHATAILAADFPDEFEDILDVLENFTLLRSSFLVSGGSRSYISRFLDSAFYGRGWKEQRFQTRIKIDKRKPKKVPTHKVDCFRKKIALEIEWSNKDPFFDRDLNNFRLLFDLRVASVGVIITKSDKLIDIVKKNGKKTWDKYGKSTTWMSKLRPRIRGGGAGGCPVLVFAINDQTYYEDVTDADASQFRAKADAEYKAWKAEKKAEADRKAAEKKAERARKKAEADQQKADRKAERERKKAEAAAAPKKPRIRTGITKATKPTSPNQSAAPDESIMQIDPEES